MAEIVLTDQNFKEEVYDKKGVIMVDFWAAWCGPCKMMDPILEQVAHELEGKVTIGKLNVDENPDTAMSFGVTSIPTFKVFKDGQQVGELVGAQSKDTVLDTLNRHVQ